MQQTETYKLNLIETSDNFSPAPLNENTDKVEAKFAALDGADAALDSRVTVLEGHKVVVGSFAGEGYNGFDRPRTINLGFTPIAVLFQNPGGYSPFMALTGYPFNTDEIVIVEGGFTVASRYNSRANYAFLAIK